MLAAAAVRGATVKLLDLFCGAGGCSVGYARAGFEVTGWDILPHPDYPFEMVVGDAMEALADTAYLSTFDVVVGSPPCYRFSSITPAANRDGHPDLLTPSRAALQAWGGPYVLENVPGAPMPQGVTFCGKAMGLPHARRHRLFESNLLVMSPGCACDGGAVYGVYGDHGDLSPVLRPNGTSRGNKARDVAHAQQVLGIDWMTSWDDLADSIPPAYTHYIGEQLIDQLALAA